MKNKIAIIAGVQVPGRGLGKDQELLYHIPADMKRFRDLTTGHIVIMGRTTWESIPEKLRPLPNRHNIVLTSNADYEATGAKVMTSLEEAINQFEDDNYSIFLIGGARIYEEGMNYADTLYLTEFYGDKESDTFFPDYSNFGEEVGREKHTDKKSEVEFDFIEIQKRNQPTQ
ncbi:dihydrofolate reductase [Candidatus Nomurabacteria bacterium]|nr:dihydrofolate reductase [Candidatus Nomurabacteria bacterium]